VTTESEFITAIPVTAANVPDGAVAPDLIAVQKHHGFTPSTVVGDMAYSSAELRQWAENAGTEMVARVPPASAPAGCFSKDAFKIDLEAGSVTCPAGETTRRVHHRATGGPTFYFDGRVCAGCALREACTRQNPETMRRTGKGRGITLHLLEGILQRARAAESTDRVRQLLALRPVVERRLAHLMGRGLRQARYCGTMKTQFQGLITALVTNLVRFGRLAARLDHSLDCVGV